MIPVARMTVCTCGHEGISHYDSYLFCTHEDCDCEEFISAGPEIYIQVGEAM